MRWAELEVGSGVGFQGGFELTPMLRFEGFRGLTSESPGSKRVEGFLAQTFVLGFRTYL